MFVDIMNTLRQLTPQQIVGIGLMGFGIFMLIVMGWQLQREYERLNDVREHVERERRRVEMNRQAGDMRLQSRKLLDALDRQRSQFARMMQNNRIRAQYGLCKPRKVAKILPFRRKILDFNKRG